MSEFRVPKYRGLVPYVPGEQPRERRYIKLNTNESPYPPSPRALERGRAALDTLALYPDPTMAALRAAIAEDLGVSPDWVLPTNGSDEILSFAFAAFCDADTPAVFPDITYGFYRVFADLYGVPARVIPLREDFTIAPEEYFAVGGTLFIANPNAPTGIALPLTALREILLHNRENVVVVDEAYVDFGGESALALLAEFENLVVTRTFSKSRSMAGARLGFGIAHPALIADMTAIKDSTNPYNVNRVTAEMGIGSIEDRAYFEENCKKIIETRESLAAGLTDLGFSVLPSCANFLFIRHPRIGGEALYTELRRRGILVRHFAAERIRDYNRVTVGAREEAEALLRAMKEIGETI